MRLCRFPGEFSKSVNPHLFMGKMTKFSNFTQIRHQAKITIILRNSTGKSSASWLIPVKSHLFKQAVESLLNFCKQIQCHYQLTHQWGFCSNLYNFNKARCKGCACQMFYLTVTEVIPWASALPFLRGYVKIRTCGKEPQLCWILQVKLRFSARFFHQYFHLIPTYQWDKQRTVSPHCTLIRETGRSLVFNLSKDYNKGSIKW